MGGHDVRFWKRRALIRDDHGSPPSLSRGSVVIQGARWGTATGMAVQLVQSRGHDAGGVEGIARIGAENPCGGEAVGARRGRRALLLRGPSFFLSASPLGGVMLSSAPLHWVLGISSTRLLNRDGLQTVSLYA